MNKLRLVGGLCAAVAACGMGATASAAQLDTTVAVPSVISEKAYLWLDAADAASFTIDAEGKVEKWADKSGNGNDAVAYVENDVKARGTLGEANGVPAFLMGAVGSGIDLKFTRTEKAATVFQVMDIVTDSPYANFLGDETQNFFRRGPQGQIFEYWGWDNSACNGATFKQDGVVFPEDANHRVACDAYFGAGLHVYSWRYSNAFSKPAAVSCLSADRNPTQRGRNGGRAVSELIIFESRLTDAEMQEIETYLMNKWTKEKVEALVPTFLTKESVHLWLDASDANSFTLDSDSKVEKWSDKSGNGNDAVAYVQAGATEGDAGICNRGTVGEANGVPAFLMGEAGSGIDLKFPVDTNIRTVFQVMDWSKTSPNAWFLACTKDVVGAQDTATGTACEKGHGSIDFQRGLVNANGLAYIVANNWKDWTDWKGWGNNDHIRNGVIRKNKANSDMWGLPDDGCGIYAIVTKDRPAYADCLSGDRTGLGKGEAVGVSGGKAVSELILIDRELSTKEVSAVENYLFVKWRPSDAKSTTTLSAATDIATGDSYPNLVLATGAALNIDFSAVEKGGTVCTVYGALSKTASGKIKITKASSVVRPCVLLTCAGAANLSADDFELDAGFASGYSLSFENNTLTLTRRPGFSVTIR